jgi:hypothetical protein
MKILKLYSILLLTIFLVTNSGCSQNESIVKVVAQEYGPCCGTSDPVTHKYDGNTVSNPNVFTPNGDKINDLFYPQITSEKIAIVGFFIKTMTDTIVFFRNQVLYDDLTSNAWDGKVFGNQFYPLLIARDYDGQFKYSYTIVYPSSEKAEGASFDIEGTACVIRCGEKASIFSNKAGCYFPIQFTKGVYDSKLDRGEAACFK